MVGDVSYNPIVGGNASFETPNVKQYKERRKTQPMAIAQNATSRCLFSLLQQQRSWVKWVDSRPLTSVFAKIPVCGNFAEFVFSVTSMKIFVLRQAHLTKFAWYIIWLIINAAVFVNKQLYLHLFQLVSRAHAHFYSVYSSTGLLNLHFFNIVTVSIAILVMRIKTSIFSTCFAVTYTCALEHDCRCGRLLLPEYQISSCSL